MGVSTDGMGEPETAPAPDGPQRPGYPPTAPATAVGRRGAATGQGIATRATAAIVTEMFTLPDVEYLDIAHDLSTTSRPCRQTPVCLAASCTPSRRTGHKPTYIQYADSRPALPQALRAGGTPRART